MAFKVATLWRAPVVNPVNHKALSIPVLNPIDVHGRVFLLSWFGFMIAFWSWYAFPPLMTVTIRKDLKLSQSEVANSNIISLVATLLVRLIAGPACDRFGPRLVFAGCLLAGAVPSVLAGAVTNASGLMVVRFFVGILGGTFIPCQVWTTGFFDKEVVGTANALTAGLGNAGGGITYFAMPAIFDSLVHRQHLNPHVAWRVSFIVPFILITATAMVMLLACPDTPTGSWSSRHLAVDENAVHAVLHADEVGGKAAVEDSKVSASGSESLALSEEKAGMVSSGREGSQHVLQVEEREVIDEARGEMVEKPTYREAARVIFSLHILAIAAAYFCSFGTELCINSVLGSYYLANFPKLGQTGSGNWAAMFGLLNVVCRPAGGLISDSIFRSTRSLWGKKMLIHGLAIIAGAFLIAIGISNSHSEPKMFGLMVGLAFFIEAGNGANFSLVPHVHPSANGIVSGVTGAAGNLGGVIFSIILRYNGLHYGRVFWIIGAITIGVNVAVSWIRPISKTQIGGR